MRERKSKWESNQYNLLVRIMPKNQVQTPTYTHEYRSPRARKRERGSNYANQSVILNKYIGSKMEKSRFCFHFAIFLPHAHVCHLCNKFSLFYRWFCHCNFLLATLMCPPLISIRVWNVELLDIRFFSTLLSPLLCFRCIKPLDCTIWPFINPNDVNRFLIVWFFIHFSVFFFFLSLQFY